MTHPIGLAALTVLELSPPDMVSCAADAGFDCVGLRLIPATAEEVQHSMIGDTPLVRETARRLVDTGIRCLDIEIFRLKPETGVDDYRAALETGARLGAREALVAGNDPDEARLTAHLRGRSASSLAATASAPTSSRCPGPTARPSPKDYASLPPRDATTVAY